MKTKYFKTLFLTLSLCFIFNKAFSTPDTLIMPVSVSYLVLGGGSCGGWGGIGHTNLSFDQNRYMPPGDMMYVEVQTFTSHCGNTDWHKYNSNYYPVNWYNDTANYAFTDSTNGTIHTSIDISFSSPCSVGAMCIRFVYISNTGNQTIYANVSNAVYDFAPTHFVNAIPIINGSPCDSPMNVSFQLPVDCGHCFDNTDWAEWIHIYAHFGDGNDTSFTDYNPYSHPTYYLNHIYNSVGTFNPTFQVYNGYGGGYDTLSISNYKPSAAITASSTTFCSGDSVVLNAVYNLNRTYQWKKGGNDISGATSSNYTALIGGVYKVSVTNIINGCSKTSVPGTVVTVNPRPNSIITPQGPTTFCAGGSVVLNANTGAGLTYQWKKGGTDIPAATSDNYTATIAGVYKVREVNNYGCAKLSTGVVVSIPCRQENELTEISESISIFPNPTKDFITIQFPQQPTGTFQLTITDVLGKKVFRKTFSSPTFNFQLQTSAYPSGIYFVKAGNKAGKFVKQ